MGVKAQIAIKRSDLCQITRPSIEKRTTQFQKTSHMHITSFNTLHQITVKVVEDDPSVFKKFVNGFHVI